MRISRTTRSCTLRVKGYGTYQTGAAFGTERAYSTASSRSPGSRHPDHSAFALTYILRLRSCRSIGAFIISPLPHVLTKKCTYSRVPLLHGSYPASSLLRTQPPPSRLRPISRCLRLYGLPCSTDFSMGRGRLLQLLSMSLSPCCPYHPAGVTCRVSQICDTPCCLRPKAEGSASGVNFLRGHLWVHSRCGPVTCSPSLTRALSIGFIGFVSSTDAIQATGL